MVHHPDHRGLKILLDPWAHQYRFPGQWVPRHKGPCNNLPIYPRVPCQPIRFVHSLSFKANHCQLVPLHSHFRSPFRRNVFRTSPTVADNVVSRSDGDGRPSNATTTAISTSHALWWSPANAATTRTLSFAAHGRPTAGKTRQGKYNNRRKLVTHST